MRAKTRAPRTISPDARGQLIWALMKMYSADAEFRAALGKLGMLADTVDRMPLEEWQLRQPPFVSRDAPEARYRYALADTAHDFGLDRLPSVGGDPSGQDLLHRWAANRSRRPASTRKPERFALAGGWGGPVPTVRFVSPGDEPEPDGASPRIVVEWDIADEPRKAVFDRIREQMDEVEEWWSKRGYAIGRGKAKKTLERDTRSLFEWMRHGRKGTDAAAARGARRLADLLSIDLRDGQRAD